MQRYKGLARIYDVLKDEQLYRIWPGYIKEILNEYGCKTGSDIIDAACGTGDITIELRNAGYKVTGIDISEDMLLIAQEKARHKGMDISFICQDIKNLSVHKPVDAIICVNDGVNYLEDEGALIAFLKSARTSLKEDGLLLFDISSANKLENMAGEVYTYDTDDIAYIWSNALSVDKASLLMDITFFIKNHDGSFKRFEEHHVQHLYDIDYLKKMLHCTGFKIEAVYSCLNQSEPKKDDQRIQFVTRAVGRH